MYKLSEYPFTLRRILCSFIATVGALFLLHPASGCSDSNKGKEEDAGWEETPDAFIVDGAIDASDGPVDATTDGSQQIYQDAFVDASPPCYPPENPAGPDVVLAPPFDNSYAAYDLGQIPGVPASSVLGGCVISYYDENVLLIAVDSESPSGAIYAVPVVRNACDHIIAFEGTSEKVADTPHIDANLAYGPNNVLFYSQWPVNMISQLLPGASSPSSTTDLAALGVGGGGPGGLGFVPPSLPAAGELRILTWSAGYWYQLSYTPSGDVFTISSPLHTATVANGPGGFAYVPEGSPGFSVQSIIMAEWSNNTVAVYEANSQGDPIEDTRRPFFSAFPRPWGAYFEPETGDYIFLSWGTGTDRVYIVQGFSRPFTNFH